MTHPLSEGLRKLASTLPAVTVSGGTFSDEYRTMDHPAATALRRAADALDEKADLDTLVAESVSRQESGHIAAEVLRLREVLAQADARAVRWEDKVSQYGRELKEIQAERDELRQQLAVRERDCEDLKATVLHVTDAAERAEAEAARYREALEWYADPKRPWDHTIAAKALREPETEEKTDE